MAGKKPSDQPATSRRRTFGKPFKKGQSGNPGGRPKGVGALVREKTRDGAEMVEFLVKILRDKDESTHDRTEAAKLLMDRAWGKAAQAVEVSGPNGQPVQADAVVTYRIPDNGRNAR